MMNAVSILQDFSADRLENIEKLVIEFLQPILKQEGALGCSEAKGYGNFMVKFLHICVTKLKCLTDKDSTKELLAAAELCCECYLKVSENLTLDDEYLVPKLVYHILNSIKHEDYVEDIFSLSELMFTFLSTKSPLSTAGEKVTHSLFCHLWNLANQLGPKDGNRQKIDIVLKLRQYALMYLSLLPNISMLQERFLDIMSQVSCINKENKDKNLVEKCDDIFTEIYSHILSSLTSRNSKDIVLPCLKIFSSFLEHLIKVGKYNLVEKISEEFLSSDFASEVTVAVKQLAEIISHVYRLSNEVKVLMSMEDNSVSQKEGNSEKQRKGDKCKTTHSKKDNSKELKLCKLKDNKGTSMVKLIGSLTQDEIYLLHSSLHFVCTLLGTKIAEVSCFSIEVTESLLFCVSTCINVSKIILGNAQKQEKSSSESPNGTKTESKVRINQTLQMSYFKKLLLMFHLLQSSESPTEVSLYDTICCLAAEFEDSLGKTESVLTPKAMYIHRKNCAYICSKIATHCIRQEKYEPAVLLNTIVLKQLRICDNANVSMLIESLVDCYIWSGQWDKAVEVILETSVVEGNMTSCVALWVKLKRDAVAQQQLGFIKRTLSSEIKKLKNHKMSTVDMLVAEYNVWKKISRRNYMVEYHILYELTECMETGLERCIYMIELAKNMYMTGQLFKTSSADTLLSDVIGQIEDTGPQSQAILALAYFSKYVVSHEDLLQNLTANLEKKEQDTVSIIDETGDTNQSTPNRHRSEASASQKTPDRHMVEPTNQGSCFTLATEKPYVKYLHKAVDLWEECFGQTKMISGIDLSSHVEAMVACGTRLLAMKQPTLALKVLQLAQSQIKNLQSNNLSTHLEEKLSKVLMLLGMYKEAEKLLSTEKGDNHTSMSRLLLKAELHLLMGKKQKGMEILNEVLGQERNGHLTKSLCLANGCAKRLLSMFLCVPGDHLASANNQNLLAVANDAVRSHLSVIRLIDKTKSSDKKSDSVDKWTFVLEVLQSLLHLCQLYRLIGLPRNSLCYLKEGLKISQAQGLPRWSLEFLFEMLRIQSMEADYDSIIKTIDDINRMLNSSEVKDYPARDLNQYSPDVDSTSLELSVKKMTFESSNSKESMEMEVNNSSNCFGFENLTVTPKVILPRSNVTPGKDNSVVELDNSHKLKLAQVTVPLCRCAKNDHICDDESIHRLFTEAGIVIIESLVAIDMKAKAYDSLGKFLTDNNKKIVDFRKMVKTNSEPSKKKGKSNCDKLNMNSEHFDPRLKYLSLEASCIQAEVFGQQKQYNKVHQIWHDIKKLEESGFFLDVLHSNILVARLALCEATSFLMSLQFNNSDSELNSSTDDTNYVNSKELDLSSHEIEFQDTIHEVNDINEADVSEIQNKFEDMTLSTKKVTFKDKDEVIVMEESKNKGSKPKGKGSRKKLINDTQDNDQLVSGNTKCRGADLITPMKKFSWSTMNNIASTPNSQVLIHTPGTAKKGMNQNTPWSVNNRRMDLDRLLEDSDDDMPVFPQLKPVTPKTNQSVCKKSTKSKADSKKSKRKTANESSKGIICDLSKALQQSSSPSESICGSASETTKTTNIPIASNDSCVISKKTVVKEHVDIHSPSEDLFTNGNNKLKIIGLAVQKEDKSKMKSKTGKENMGRSSRSKAKEKDSQTNLNQFDNKTNSNEIETSGQQSDVFDFDNEASPVASKTNKEPKGRASAKSKNGTKMKTTVAKVPRNSKTKNTVSEKQLLKPDESSCQTDDRTLSNNVRETLPVTESKEETSTKAGRGRKTAAGAKRPARGRKAVDETEIPCSAIVHLDHELNVSVDSIEIKSDSDDEAEHCSAISHKNCLASLNLSYLSPQNNNKITVIIPNMLEVESISSDVVSSPEVEPIEVLRGDRKPVKCKGRGKQKQIKSSDINNEQNGSDENESGVEQMRSSRIPSLKGLSERLNYSPEVSVVSINSSGASTPDQQDIISALENIYDQIRRLAPYPRHSDICQILALHYLHTNPQRAAFLLSDSIAVTFRHQAMLNLNKKVRQQKTGSAEEGGQELSSLESYVDGLLFNKDESNLQEMIDIIPPDWTVLQLSVVQPGTTCQQMLLTRFARNRTPIVLQLPGFSSPQGRQILSSFSTIIKKSQDVMKITVKADWWKIRKDLDYDMENLLDHIEKFWIGHWRGALTSCQYSERAINKLVKDVKKQTKMEIETCHAEILLCSVEHLSERQLHRCASELLGSKFSSSDVETIISLVKTVAAADEGSSPGHVVLILDKAIQHLPWECIPALKNHSVSRMPCLSHLYTQLNYLQSQESIFVRGINPEKTYYMVNPDNNLPNAESVFKEWFESEKGWKGIVGKPPTKEQFAEAITDHDLFIYCGHGSGGRYFHGDDIEKLQGHAAIILMGCSSGKLSVRGQLEPSGMMISYFLAGCPCMIANLWDVTDRDIDKYLHHLLQTWLTSENGTSLSKLVQESRQACKMKYLVGCAPVVYGLPVIIKKQ